MVPSHLATFLSSYGGPLSRGELSCRRAEFAAVRAARPGALKLPTYIRCRFFAGARGRLERRSREGCRESSFPYRGGRKLATIVLIAIVFFRRNRSARVTDKIPEIFAMRLTFEIEIVKSCLALKTAR
jgi:hypothetical protein